MQLAATQEKLKAAGVETLAVVNTQLDRARLYVRYRPTRLTLLADPDAVTHQAYRLPAFEIVDEARLARGPSRPRWRKSSRPPPTRRGSCRSP